MGAGSSSALNQALATSAKDLQTNLYGQFAKQQFEGQSQAMTQLMSLIQQPQFEAMIRDNPGIIGPLIQAMGSIGGAAAMALL